MGAEGTREPAGDTQHTTALPQVWVVRGQGEGKPLQPRLWPQMEVAEPRFIHLSNKFSNKSASCGLDIIFGVGDTAKNKMEQRHPCPHAPQHFGETDNTQNK